MPHDKCTELKCAAFRYTNRSMQFGTQLIHVIMTLQSVIAYNNDLMQAYINSLEI